MGQDMATDGYATTDRELVATAISPQTRPEVWFSQVEEHSLTNGCITIKQDACGMVDHGTNHPLLSVVFVVQLFWNCFCCFVVGY